MERSRGLFCLEWTYGTLATAALAVMAPKAAKKDKSVSFILKEKVFGWLRGGF